MDTNSRLHENNTATKKQIFFWSTVSWVVVMIFGLGPLLLPTLMMFASDKMPMSIIFLVLAIDSLTIIVPVVCSILAHRRNDLSIAKLPLKILGIVYIVVFFLSVLLQTGGGIIQFINQHMYPDEYISFDAKVPKSPSLFVCPKQAVFSYEKGSVTEETQKMTRTGWNERGKARFVGNLKEGSITLEDERDRASIDSCLNPDGKTITDMVKSSPFFGVVPTDPKYFVCTDRILRLNGSTVEDTTDSATKDGWDHREPGKDKRFVASFGHETNTLYMRHEFDASYVKNCRNSEGVTVVDILAAKSIVIQ